MGRLALVVDDNKTDQMVITALLERDGFSVLTASNGHDAIEVMGEEKIDLFIVDGNLTGRHFNSTVLLDEF